MLARTNPQAEKKQQGISFILVDMKTPGVTVRPIQLIDGGHEVNEVFFDEVKVPAENLVGQENRGWDYAKFLLTNERMGIARIGITRQRLRRIVELAKLERYGDGKLLDQSWFREKLAAVEIELKALEITQLRVIAEARKRGAHGAPDPNSSILKIKGSELQQATTELMMDVVGPYVAPFPNSLDDEDQTNEPPIGPDYAAAAGPDLFQLAKSLDLWRIERNPAQHHRQSHSWFLTNILLTNNASKDSPPKVMDFDLTDDQRLLKDSIDKLLAPHYGDFAKRKSYQTQPNGFDPAIWQEYAEAGILGLPFPEAQGGFGGGAIETMIVMEALGTSLALEPYLTSTLLCGDIIQHAATKPSSRKPAPRSSPRAAKSWPSRRPNPAPATICTMSASPPAQDGEDYLLEGEKSVVLGGGAADAFIVSARTSGNRRDPHGITLFLVDANTPGISRRAYPTQDGTWAAEISFAQARVPATHILGTLGEGLPLLTHGVDIAIAGLCAEAVGAMDALIKLTVDYLKTRKQFGVAIGSFQALQHRTVDMLVMLEQARSMAIYAALSPPSPTPPPATPPSPPPRYRSAAAPASSASRPPSCMAASA